MARLRSRTAARSTDTAPVRTPYSAARRAWGAGRAPATPVEADPAKLVTLDQRYPLARLRQLNGEEPAALAGPDHDRVVVLLGHCVFSPCPRQSLVPFLSSAPCSRINSSLTEPYCARDAACLRVGVGLPGAPAGDSR